MSGFFELGNRPVDGQDDEVGKHAADVANDFAPANRHSTKRARPAEEQSALILVLPAASRRLIGSRFVGVSHDGGFDRSADTTREIAGERSAPVFLVVTAELERCLEGTSQVMVPEAGHGSSHSRREKNAAASVIRMVKCDFAAPLGRQEHYMEEQR
jgi:hypothetical protein